MKKIALLFAVILLFGCSAFAENEIPKLVNIAKIATIEVSSVFGGNVMPPNLAVDDSFDTAWANGYYPNGQNYFKIKLGVPVNIHKISITMFYNANKNFEIRLLEGGSNAKYDLFKSYSGSEGAVGVQDFELTDEQRAKRYSEVLIISKDNNGSIGVADIKVFVPEVQTGNINVAKNKKVTGGSNAFGLLPSSLVDGNSKTMAAIQNDPFYIDIDLGKKYAIGYIELYTSPGSNGGRRENIQIFASNSPNFEEEGKVLLKEFNEFMEFSSSYGFETDGNKYRYIRFTCGVKDFVPMNELTVYAKADENFSEFKINESSVSIVVNNYTPEPKTYILLSFIVNEVGNITYCVSNTKAITGECTLNVAIPPVMAGHKLKSMVIGEYKNMNIFTMYETTEEKK